MEEKPIYEEDFVNSRVSNDKHSINYVLEQIAEVHNEEAGWVVGEPIITPNSDGRTVTIIVHLKQYERTNGHSR